MTVIDLPDSRLVKVIWLPGNVWSCFTGTPDASVYVMMVSPPSTWASTAKAHWSAMTTSSCVGWISRDGGVANAGVAMASAESAENRMRSLRTIVPPLVAPAATSGALAVLAAVSRAPGSDGTSGTGRHHRWNPGCSGRAIPEDQPPTRWHDDSRRS